MTFKEFEAIVKTRHPNATVYKHGAWSGAKINVGVEFNPPYGKVYKYQGSYCYVLNRLGIRAMYEHDLACFEKQLELHKKHHGEIDIFGNLIDNTERIATLEKYIQDVKATYIIVKG